MPTQANPYELTPIRVYFDLKLGMPRPSEIGPGIRNDPAASIESSVRRIACSPILNDPSRLAVHRWASSTTSYVRWITIVERLFPDSFSDSAEGPLFVREHSWRSTGERDVKNTMAALARHFNQCGFVRVGIRDLARMKFTIARHGMFVEPSRLLCDAR
jgi:hypothetical protein